MIRKFFRLEELGSTPKREVLAGLTTFITMAYIIIVNPAILSAAGIPKDACTTATIISAFFGTMVMGLYANRPFAIAPYMGENAFIAYTVVAVLGYSWQTALGAVFVGGVLFTILTLLKVRSWLANSIPEGLKIAFAVGIGLFLAFIGLNDTGIVALGTESAPVQVGDLGSGTVLLALLGFFLISLLMALRVKGAMLLGIIVVTALAFITGLAPLPERIVSMPPSLSSTFLKLDIAGALTWGFFSVILTVFVMDFVDTMGTLLGVAYKADMLDENGELPHIEKPMLADSLATVVGSLLGTSTTGTFIESAAGVQEGGRSGLTAVTTGILFLLALFFAPLFTAVPACAYGPVLIVVGFTMVKPFVNLKTEDMTELVPAVATIVLMSFSYNLGVGMTAGFVLYPLMKVLTGRARQVHAGLWILGALSLLFYFFYPY
ncbi:NCS2 family permease [Candidatus Fermentibacteria bacterium]|nr:NCS2 family permease [Candidatus Fermentibacteria bacterium]